MNARMYVPDSTDKRIVHLLGRDALQNRGKLAQQLKLSSATVRRRMRKLLSSGLLRIVGVVEAAKFGFPLVALITLDVSSENLESAMEVLTQRPEIRWAAITTGRFDIVALARFPSTDNLSEFMTKELAHLEGLKNSETFICLDVKKGSFVPFTEM